MAVVVLFPCELMNSAPGRTASRKPRWAMVDGCTCGPAPPTSVAEGGRCFQTSSITSPPPAVFQFHTRPLTVQKKRKKKMLPSEEDLSSFPSVHIVIWHVLCEAPSPRPPSIHFTLLNSSLPLLSPLVYLSSSLTSHLFAFTVGPTMASSSHPPGFSMFFFLFFNTIPQRVTSLIWCPTSQTLTGAWWTSEELHGSEEDAVQWGCASVCVDSKCACFSGILDVREATEFPRRVWRSVCVRRLDLWLPLSYKSSFHATNMRLGKWIEKKIQINIHWTVVQTFEWKLWNFCKFFFVKY